MTSARHVSRGIFKIATFNPFHYQFENEPFAQKNWPGLPLSPGRAVFCSRRHTSFLRYRAHFLIFEHYTSSFTTYPLHFYLAKLLLHIDNHSPPPPRQAGKEVREIFK